ncbi:spondin domain-containing protein [Ancylomarina sp.]|uniref:spondin domain-containing protein n=1 Tax=Ancylomarina sp. TaxID=1970196 RepID=UPI003569B074
MRKFRSYFYLLIGLVFVSCNKSDGPIETGIESEASYRVTFTMHWNSTDFPTDYPSNAHFSPLIGWSHPTTSTFFNVGTTASAGIEDMAENGGTAILQAELEAKIVNNEGLDFVLGSGLGSGEGEITVEVLVNAANSSVTLVSMVAPSPDWYVAAFNVNLYNGSNFVDTKIVTAAVYDAGTDSGVTFASADANTDLKVPISLFVDAPLGDGTNLAADFATITFVKN